MTQMRASQRTDSGPASELVHAGRSSIDRASESMPVLSRLRDEHGRSRPLDRHRIAGCVHLTRETAVLIRGLVAAGAEVAWTGGDELSTQDDVAAALAAEGVRTFSRSGMTTAEVDASIESVLDAFGGPPTILVDNGGRLIVRALARPAHYVRGITAATEKTTEGVRDLRVLAQTTALPFPVMTVNDALTKLEVDNTHGTGQSTIDGIMRASGMLLAGKVVVVIGYGHVGRGLAERARGLGARVVVCCRSSATAVRARLAGFVVLSVRAAAPIGDVFCTATGYDGVIVDRHLALMKDGALLCNTGRSMTEIDLEALRARTVEVQQVRPHMARHRLRDGRRLHLLSGGGLVNLDAAEGNASEVMDVTFAHQLLAVVAMARGGWTPGLHPPPPGQDERLAALELTAMGVRYDSPRAEQRPWMPSWEEAEP